MNKLEKICKVKRQQLQKIKKNNCYKDFKKTKLRGFLSNLKKIDNAKFPIIAEIKKKSPSRGILCKNFDPIKIVIDETSMQFINGSKLEFVEDMIGSYFKVSNPIAKSTCGCGTSFSL